MVEEAPPRRPVGHQVLDPWPLRHLVLRTPRLELRPDDDAGLLELVEETHRGIRPPDYMPFETEWTDADPADREIDTGSWIGLRHQGRGIGTEMRAAVLQWAFDHLGATQARSAAFVDNVASLRVSEKLGYRPDGGVVQVRRGRRAEEVRLLVSPAAFRRPGWTLTVEGLAPCRAMLDAVPRTEADGG